MTRDWQVVGTAAETGRRRAVVAWALTAGLAGLGCGGGTIDDGAGGGDPTAGGEQAASADGGTAAVDPAAVDPAAASLDEPPPGDPNAPATLASLEGVAAEGVVREEARSDGGVRVVVVLPVAADGNALLEIQSIPARSADIASFALRAQHATARWTACTTFGLEADGRAAALPEARVLSRAAPSEGVVEEARTTGEVQEVRRLAAATTARIVACNESFVATAATRPALQRFLARVDELTPAAPATPPAPTKRPRRGGRE